MSATLRETRTSVRRTRLESDAHDLRSGWWLDSPHPVRWTRRTHHECCPICGLLIGYTYRGVRYGPARDETIARCVAANPHLSTTRRYLAARAEPQPPH